MLRYGTRSQGMSVLPAHLAHICKRNEPYLPLSYQPKLVLIYRCRRDGRLSWPWQAGADGVASARGHCVGYNECRFRQLSGFRVSEAIGPAAGSLSPAIK